MTGVVGTKRTVFQDWEIAIIREHFNPVKSENSCREIHKNYLRHRTPRSIKSKASRLGLERPYFLRRWEQEEIDIIRNNGEKIPFPLIYSKLKVLWEKNGWKKRSAQTVKNKLILFGHEAQGNDSNYYNKVELAQALGCSDSTIYNWINNNKEYAKILNPLRPSGKERGTLLFHVKNIRRFIKEYPGEIAKCRPDILWLLSIVFEKDVW